MNSIFLVYWGLGIGDWGLGIGPNPQSPVPNPQTPSPIPKLNNNIEITLNSKKIMVVLMEFVALYRFLLALFVLFR